MELARSLFDGVNGDDVSDMALTIDDLIWFEYDMLLLYYYGKVSIKRVATGHDGGVLGVLVRFVARVSSVKSQNSHHPLHHFTISLTPLTNSYVKMHHGKPSPSVAAER